MISVDILVVYFFVEFHDFDGKEMMWQSGNDLEKWYRGSNDNHVVKIKGSKKPQRNTFGWRIRFYCDDGPVHSAWNGPQRVRKQTCFDSRPAAVKILLRLARIQSSLLVYEVSILRADAEQVEVQPAVAPHAWKEMIKLFCFPAGSCIKPLRAGKSISLNHQVDVV